MSSKKPTVAQKPAEKKPEVQEKPTEENTAPNATQDAGTVAVAEQCAAKSDDWVVVEPEEKEKPTGAATAPAKKPEDNHDKE